jgi:hypothetical protein
MISVLVSLVVSFGSWLRTRAALQLELLALRHQLQVLNRARPRRLRLATDAPISRGVEPPTNGRIVAIPEVGGLHHRYGRRAA